MLKPYPCRVRGLHHQSTLLPQQHRGSGGVSFGRPGRITGSVNFPAAHLLDPTTNTFLPAEALRERFEAIGAMDRHAVLLRFLFELGPGCLPAITDWGID